jgi:hypothetical protein
MANVFAPLPPPWNARPIGPVAARTSATRVGDTFHITGAGKNIDEQADAFFFVFQPLSSSVVFQARLADTPGTNSAYMRCGIMMRGSARPRAPLVFIGVSSEALWWIVRSGEQELASSLRINGVKTVPLLLRLTRKGDRFVGAYSTTDTDWIPCQTNDVSMPPSGGWMGFAVCSGHEDQQAGAVFDAISIRQLKTGD